MRIYILAAYNLDSEGFMKISIYLDKKTELAYSLLRSLPGGFNLSQAVRQVILQTARDRGLAEDKEENKCS